MKIFLDSAEIKDIKQARSFGVLDGVTTNPSLKRPSYFGSNREKRSIFRGISGIFSGKLEGVQ